MSNRVRASDVKKELDEWKERIADLIDSTTELKKTLTKSIEHMDRRISDLEKRLESLNYAFDKEINTIDTTNGIVWIILFVLLIMSIIGIIH